MKNIFSASFEKDKAATKYITLGEKGKYDISIYPDGSLKVNKKKINILIEEDSDGFTYIIFNDQKYPVEVLEISQNRYTILINGVSYKFSVETPISYSRKKHLEKITPQSTVEEIIAPMPGKILEIFVEEGSEIKENDPLFILEAMKMANEIKSNVSGIVKKINIKPEETVMKDSILIEIEKT